MEEINSQIKKFGELFENETKKTIEPVKRSVKVIQEVNQKNMEVIITIVQGNNEGIKRITESAMGKISKIIKEIIEFEFFDDEIKSAVEKDKKNGWYYGVTYYENFNEEVDFKKALYKEKNLNIITKEVVEFLERVDIKYKKQFELTMEDYKNGRYYTALMGMLPIIDNVHNRWLQNVGLKGEYKFDSRQMEKTKAKRKSIKNLDGKTIMHMFQYFLANYLDGYAYFFGQAKTKKHYYRRNYLHHGNCDPDNVKREDLLKALILLSGMTILQISSPEQI